MLTNISADEISELANKQLDVAGRIKNIRKLGKKLVFLQLELRDKNVQAVVSKALEYEPHLEDIIHVSGILRNNTAVKEGIPGYELDVHNISCLSPCVEQVPTLPNASNNRIININNRHLSLRDKNVRDVFTVKSDYIQALRNFLLDEQFIEINTPSIVLKGVDGPVNAFKMNYFGKDAYLSLSSMLYHHILISGGLEKFFEIRQMYRQDPSQTNSNLSEFLTLDFSIAYYNREKMIKMTENLVHKVAQVLESKNALKINVPDEFPVICYNDLINQIKQKKYKIEWGETRHLSKKYSKAINSLFPSFFWIVDLPEESKAFYCSSKLDLNNRHTCNDFQLWFGNNDLADGGERIVNYFEAKDKLEKRGLPAENFEHYLNSLKHGIPPFAGIGIGVERLLMTLTNTQNIRDIVLFPRDKNIIYP